MKCDAYETEAMLTDYYPRIDTERGRIPVYPALAMLGEIGELAEKILDSAPRVEIAKEIGDVLWYICGAARDLGFHLSNVVDADTLPDFSGWVGNLAVENHALALVACTGKFSETFAKKPWRDSTFIERDDALERLQLVYLRLWAVAACFDLSMAEIAQINLYKLRSRRERGTVHGSGDNR